MFESWKRVMIAVVPTLLITALVSAQSVTTVNQGKPGASGGWLVRGVDGGYPVTVSGSVISQGVDGGYPVAVTGSTSVSGTASVRQVSFKTYTSVRIGDCATVAGDGGTIVFDPTLRYRCVARNNGICMNNGAPVTTCSLTAMTAPSGIWIPQDQPEEFQFYGTPEDAGTNDAATMYIATPSGTACLSCTVMTPQ